jgi:hypothetical protein
MKYQCVELNKISVIWAETRLMRLSKFGGWKDHCSATGLFLSLLVFLHLCANKQYLDDCEHRNGSSSLPKALNGA